MEKNHSILYKIFLLPVIVALITTLSIQFIDRDKGSELIGFTMFENLLLFGLTFLSIYMFIMIFVVTIEFYLSKKLKSKVTYFILINIIGLILIGCIDIWVLKHVELKSLYLVFPLFSLLSQIQLGFRSIKEG